MKNPYSQALNALDEQYGQPRQFVLNKFKKFMSFPHINAGDGHALDKFTVHLQVLVFLGTMNEKGKAELL